MTNKNPFPSEYDDQLQELGVRVRTAQLRTALARNRERVFLNWSIGKDILARQGTGAGERASSIGSLVICNTSSQA